MISLRTIAIWLGMMIFVMWATAVVGTWTWWITMPLSAFSAWVAADLDIRDRRMVVRPDDDS